MTTPTPETDANIWTSICGMVKGAHSPEYGDQFVPATFARTLERERDGALELLGGYKMDLDEARERNLRLVNDNIVLTKDRDAWKAKALDMELDRNRWRDQSQLDGRLRAHALERLEALEAKAERTCKWTFSRRSQITGRCDSECGSKDAVVWLYDPQSGYVFCPHCGGRIIKEEK